MMNHVQDGQGVSKCRVCNILFHYEVITGQPPPSICLGCSPKVRYDPTEQDEVVTLFAEMLRAVTQDGGKKRAAGLKPSWKVDQSHEAAIWSHINKWKHGVAVDPDSGAHPLVHCAWRCLAIAWQETNKTTAWVERRKAAREQAARDGFV